MWPKFVAGEAAHSYPTRARTKAADRPPRTGSTYWVCGTPAGTSPSQFAGQTCRRLRSYFARLRLAQAGQMREKALHRERDIGVALDSLAGLEYPADGALQVRQREPSDRRAQIR